MRHLRFVFDIFLTAFGGFTNTLDDLWETANGFLNDAEHGCVGGMFDVFVVQSRISLACTSHPSAVYSHLEPSEANKRWALTTVCAAVNHPLLW